MLLTMTRMTVLAPAFLLAGMLNVCSYADNFVSVEIERIDDFLFPSDQFAVLFSVQLPDVAGVTGVDMTFGDSTVASMEGEGSEWEGEVGFVDLASLKAMMHGTWTIEIFGSSESTSTFTLNANAVLDGDLCGTPMNVFPANGATDVDPEVTFTWDDPTAGGADIIVAFAGDDFDEQQGNSLFGTLLLTDTSWQPTFHLQTGLYEYGIVYFDYDSSSLAGTLTVTSGTIAWGNSPFDPVGYPLSTPLVLLGCESIYEMTVLNTCPSDTNRDGTVNVIDLLAVLGAWNSCGGCPEDVNHDGNVDVVDLLQILGDWGTSAGCP